MPTEIIFKNQGVGTIHFHGLKAFNPEGLHCPFDDSQAERENAILGLLEETKKETAELAEKQHWEAMAREWEADKQRILAAVVGTGTVDASLADVTFTARYQSWALPVFFNFFNNKK